MKKIYLSLLAGLLLSLAAFTQNYSVTVYGSVMMVVQNTITPVPGQEVIITIDSSAYGFYYQNAVYTDESGYYEDFVEIPGYSGYEFVHAMTYDSCIGQYQYNQQPILPGAELQPMDFYLCSSTPPDCQASFYYMQEDPNDPYTFSFFDMSYGNYTQVIWDFGDSTTSTEQNPVHTFPGEGNYYVCLTISNGSDCNSTFCDFIMVGTGWNGCENYFLYSNANNDPFTLNFEGFLYSGQTAQSYWWDFGDGTYGEGQFVTHTYSPGPGNAGIYMVGLSTIVYDSMGDSCYYTSYQEVFLGYPPPPGGCESFILPLNMYGLSVDFEGYTVSPHETQYTWEFGDGVTASGQFVSHTYPAPGMYNVILQTIDATGCTFQTFLQIWVDSQGQGCNNYFTYEQTDSLAFTFTGFVYLNNGGTYPDSTSTFSWDFGDGTTGAGQTITHYFQENPSGGYNVCLTTTTVLADGTVCTAIYCEYIYLAEPAFSIFGTIYLENNMVADQAVVHLMTMDTLWQGVVELQTILTDSMGFYVFENVPMYNNRMFYVQAELAEGSAYFGQYLPTYHISALSWEQATPILPLMNWPADIFMIAGTAVSGGNGLITGVVSELGSRQFVNDVEVVLMDEESNPLMYLRSDEQGQFTFENLPLDTYIIHAEIMGIHTVQAQVTLSAENPSASVEVKISGNEANIVFGIAEPVVLEKAGEIYPNPVNDDAKIDLTVKKTARIEVSIIGITGQLMNAESLILDAGTHNINLYLESLPEGIYLVRIMSEYGDMINRKLVKY